MTKGATLVPLLGIDVWEHAYYLQVNLLDTVFSVSWDFGILKKKKKRSMKQIRCSDRFINVCIAFIIIILGNCFGENDE